MSNSFKVLMTNKFVQKVPFHLKIMCKYLLSNKGTDPVISKHEDKIIVAVAADYGNLGDIAITYAQVKYLEEYFPNHKIVTIYANDIYLLSKYKNRITPSDIITIIGGGNMGDSYKVLEDSRRYIINLFPKNKIISFPQSIDFKSSKSLQQSINVYSKHSNLHIFAREPKSFEKMKTSFRDNHVYLVPDIVLSLKNMESKTERDGITICLRNDLEKNLSVHQKENLVLSITKKYEKVYGYDTYIANLPKELGEQELIKIWDVFKKSKVVITDRLHGMIFCAITKTPCVVLPNSNHKIAATYKNWLANLNYIHFVEKFDEEEILNYVDALYNMKSEDFSINIDFSKKFELILDALNSDCRTHLGLISSVSEKINGLVNGVLWPIYRELPIGKLGFLMYLLSMDLDLLIFFTMGMS